MEILLPSGIRSRNRPIAIIFNQTRAMKSLVISSEGFGRCARERCAVSAVPYVHKKINSQVSEIGIMMRQKSESDTVGRGKCHRLRQCLDSCWILKQAGTREFFCSFNKRRTEGLKKHEFQKQINCKLRLHFLAMAFLRIWSTLQIFNYSHLSALVSIAENKQK